MENKEKNFVSAVVYVHNVENRIEEFLKMLIVFMEENFEYSEIICVNDFSEDGSVEKIKETSSEVTSTSITVINMSYFHGLEMAMNAGVGLAIGDFVFEFDRTVIDFDREDVMKIYRRALEGYDIVSASPNKKEHFTSVLFYKAFEGFSDMTYQMATESFRVLSRRVINRISSMNKTIPYRKAVYANCGLKTDNMKYEVRIGDKNRKDKKEKKYRSGLAVDSLLLFTNMGFKFSMLMTLLMMLVSVFMIIYSVVIYAMAHPVEGWTTTILFLSVAFFGIFGVLTVIVKYLQLLIDLVFKRKHYSFESIEKIV